MPDARPVEARSGDVLLLVGTTKGLFLLRVYRTRDAGGSWHALERGLPQGDAFETVLRDALALDPLRPAGVYFGTRSGKVYGSRDEGESWDLVADGLPPVVRDRVLDERGEVRPHVNLFVNGQNVRFAAGLDIVVPAQAEISILPAVSGGAGASQEVES